MSDVLNEVTGNFGKWQLCAILIIFLCKIPAVWFLSIILFTAPAPKSGDFWCQPPDNITNHTEWVLQSHPIRKYGTDKEFQIDFCRVYKDAYDDKTIKLFEFSKGDNVSIRENRKVMPCVNFHFNSDFHSVIREYKLVCSRRLLANLSQSLHIVGLLIGGIVAHFMLKRFSPKTVMLNGMLAQIFFGIMCGQTKYFELHALLRCLVAACCSAMVASGQLIIADITGGRAKTVSIVLYELFWSIGLIILPGLSIFFNNWSHLYIVISVPTLIMVFLHRFIPDSPRWMLLHDRIKKSKEILVRSAEVNKRDVPNQIDDLLSLAAGACTSQQEKEATWISLWYESKCSLLPIYYAWAIFVLLFNTMILNMSSLGQKFLHFNVVMMGFSELIGMFIGLYLIMYTRRKWIWVGFLNMAAGLCTYSVWLIPSTIKDTHQTGLAMIACIALKTTISSAMALLTACTADLFVPEQKKIVMLSATIWSRAWILWAPFVGALNTFGSLVPVSVMAMLTVIGGFLCTTIGYDQINKAKSHLKNTNVELILNKENCKLLESKS
ncbi:organic cation transporter protein-like [Bradysia coprophila]|uniref:organic cation transporter protein-like n=1 Tax=Bradysia coprophila TaxID=38358 RepID=UPI00187D70DA|nr:organic cation transporter protein-like [Bradysia coprophila]